MSTSLLKSLPPEQAEILSTALRALYCAPAELMQEDLFAAKFHQCPMLLEVAQKDGLVSQKADGWGYCLSDKGRKIVQNLEPDVFRPAVISEALLLKRMLAQDQWVIRRSEISAIFSGSKPTEITRVLASLEAKELIAKGDNGCYLLNDALYKSIGQSGISR